MVQILPENPSFGTGLARNLGRGFTSGVETGTEFSQQMRRDRQNYEQKQSQENPDFTNVISSIKGMEDLIGNKGIGLSGAFNLFSDARYNRGKFQGLQASLMPLFKSLFPRGMTEKEFKHVNDKWIPQPGDSEENIKGKLSALKQMVGENYFKDVSKNSGQTERPPLSSFGE